MALQRSIPIAALLLAVAALVAAAPAPPAPPAAAPPEGGSGTEDDPWLLDIDDLLEQGYAVVITPEDTIALADAGVDTIRVRAPRLRVSDLVRRIGERMERDYGRVHGLEYTAISRAVLHWDSIDPDEVRREERVEGMRIARDADGEERMARLFSSVRTYEGGELVETEEDPEVAEIWQEDVVGGAMDVPFSLVAADRYRFEILERTLIGDHLVFKIGFTPKSRFEPGLDGVVWIDYGDLAIRRMEGRVTGPSPVPLFIASIPRLLWTQRRVGDRWLSDTMHADLFLTDLPLLPDRVTIAVEMRDYVIDGVAQPREETP